MFEIAAAMLLAGAAVAVQAILVTGLLVLMAFRIEARPAVPAAHIPGTGTSPDREGHTS